MKKRYFKKLRKEWESAVDKALSKDNEESRAIRNARKKLLMVLFDDWVMEQKVKESSDE